MPPLFLRALFPRDSIPAHNLLAESFFSAFNGIYLGLAIFAAPVVAVTLEASPLELTVLVSAFPIGAFLGPLWAALGRRLGMQRLVLHMALWANLPMLAIAWVDKSQPVLFTLLVTLSQLLNSGMRMGQSSLYRVVYPPTQRGQVLGRLTFWSYLTMVPTILLTGWLLDKTAEMFRVLYPFAGLCGLVACLFYRLVRIPPGERAPQSNHGFRSGLRNIERILDTDRRFLLFQIAFFLTGSAFFMSTHVVLLACRDRLELNAFELALWLSVLPQLSLTLSSPFWGPVFDRIGMIPSRLLISALVSAYLVCYLLAILLGWTWGIILGSFLMGIANGGGQLTWSLASSHFAPRPEDVPLYNGIHFVLNGIRGLVLPWVGSILMVLLGSSPAVLAATLVSLGSVPVLARCRRLESLAEAPLPESAQETAPVLRVVSADEPREKNVG